MAVSRYFPFLVSVSLLALSGIYRSVGFALASVIALVVVMSRDIIHEYLQSKQAKAGVPDEAKRKIGDLEARITSIEVGIARRGF